MKVSTDLVREPVSSIATGCTQGCDSSATETAWRPNDSGGFIPLRPDVALLGDVVRGLTCYLEHSGRPDVGTRGVAAIRNEALAAWFTLGTPFNCEPWCSRSDSPLGKKPVEAGCTVPAASEGDASPAENAARPESPAIEFGPEAVDWDATIEVRPSGPSRLIRVRLVPGHYRRPRLLDDAGD